MRECYYTNLLSALWLPTSQSLLHRSGKSAFSTIREYFTNNHIIIYLILIYNFSDFATHILFYIIFSISSCHLLLKERDSLRLLVDARSVKLTAHLRFQASLFRAPSRNSSTSQSKYKEFDSSDTQWCQ